MCFFHPFLLKNWRGKCHVGVRGLTALDWRIIATTDLQAAPIHWCSPDTCLLKPKNHYKEVILVIILNFLCWIQCTAIWITMFYISPHRCNRLLSLHQRDFLFSVAAPVVPALAGFMSFLVFSQGSPLLFFSPPYMSFFLHGSRSVAVSSCKARWDIFWTHRNKPDLTPACTAHTGRHTQTHIQWHIHGSPAELASTSNVARDVGFDVSAVRCKKCGTQSLTCLGS